jgi:hypothetical protein
VADVLFIGLALALFALSAAYVRGCDRLIAAPARSGSDQVDDR